MAKDPTLQAVDQLIRLALHEDLGDRGDVTSMATLPDGMAARAVMTAKEAGIIAGLPVVDMVFRAVDPEVTVRWLVGDGARVTAGTPLGEFQGLAESLLTGERTALNFIQRLSGIATLTAQYVAAAEGTHARILDTRKTIPGWRVLDKYAVRMGGGVNHRIGLYDMVLIKDNHIKAAGGITAAVMAARAEPDAAGLAIEVEVKTLDELDEALALDVDQIMLDNMDETTMRKAVLMTEGRVPLEASGNMTLERIPGVAATGVDFISVGALTHSAPALDIAFKIVD